jgi:excisionase family DNA binding protein
MSKPHINMGLEVLERRSTDPGPEIDFEKVLDSREAAALLGIHPKTLQRLARSRKVPAIRIGKSWAFRASALDNWLRTQLAS